jgi:hypothetical protein
MSNNLLPLDGLPEEVQDQLRTYVPEMTGLFGDLLEGIILYGSSVRGDFLPGRSNLNLFFLLKSTQPDVLNRYAKVHRRWSQEQIVVPLFMTERELVVAASVFPLEYLEMQSQHRLLIGHDPLSGLQIHSSHLAVQVEQGFSGNLMRLRQRYVEGGGTQEAVTILLPLSIMSLLPCLRGLQRLLGRPITQAGDVLLKDIEAALTVDLAGLHDALHLKRGRITPGSAEMPRLFQRYATSLEVLSERVTDLKRQGRF